MSGAADGASEPVLAVRDLAVDGPRGRVFGPVSFEAAPGAVVAVAGAGGTGRTSLLLCLAGRMRSSAGTARVAGCALPGQERAVRRAVTVARATGAVDLEDAWRVDDVLALRGILRGRRVEVTEAAAAFDAAGLSAPSGAAVGDLAPADRTRLVIALALLEAAPVAVVDDLDGGADLPAQEALWRALRAVAERGTTVVAATTDAAPARGIADVIVTLERGA